MIDEIFDVSGASFASVRLRIEAPEPDPRSENTFGCHVEIKAGSEKEHSYRIFGEGQLQALLLSLAFAAESISNELGPDGRIDSPIWDHLQGLRLTEAQLAATKEKYGYED